MEKYSDYNEEYKMVFGETTREKLFYPDDEEYNVLRQEILETKRVFNTKKKLPFEDIKLVAYDEVKRLEVVRFAEKQGFRIFYIRKYRGSKLVTYGAGYFNPRDLKFYVLKDSFFENSSYFQDLYKRMYVVKNLSFIEAFQKDNDSLKEKGLHKYESASLAASCYLGKQTNFREWKDDRGKTLDAYFIKYKVPSIEEIEEKTFPDYLPTT